MITLNEKFKPLYTSDKRYILLTGGRGSGKSFHESMFLVQLSYEKGNRTLYTRYTMASAEISIIPEFNEKIELLNAVSDFGINKTEITNKKTNSDILFRGIKTSSGIQTATLKSIQGVTTWANDESEELVDEKVFDKIDLSIRVAEKQNRIILSMNPTTRQHWIYKRWIEKTHRIEMIDGFPVQISTHPDVCHIHTTYLDNINNLSQSFLDQIARMKIEQPQKYAGEIIGGWKIDLDGTVFKREKMNYFYKKDFQLDGLEGVLGYIDVADQGTDRLAMIIGHVFREKIFITDVLFTRANSKSSPEMCCAKINMHDIPLTYVEGNNQGTIYSELLRKIVGFTKIFVITNSASKHSRIVLEVGNIERYFYFLHPSEYTRESDYGQFMEELFDYMLDESSEHDDSPDATAGLAKHIISVKFPRLFRPVQSI